VAITDVIQAVIRDWRVIRRADWERHASRHAAVKTMAGVLLEERDEAKGRAERLGQSQQATLEKLAECQRDGQTARDDAEAAQEARQRAEADLDTARAEITALLMKAEKADAVLAAVRAQLDSVTLDAQRDAARIVALVAENNSLAESLVEAAKDSAHILPAPPAISTPARMPAQWCREQIARHLTAFLPSDILNVTWADNYPVFDTDALKPLLAYWKQYVMPANDDPAELFVCRKRALSLAAFMDRQVGRPLFVFSGTHPFALGADGRPGAHIWNGALDKTGALWLVDPGWLDDLVIPWPAGARASQMLGL